MYIFSSKQTRDESEQRQQQQQKDQKHFHKSLVPAEDNSQDHLLPHPIWCEIDVVEELLLPFFAILLVINCTAHAVAALINAVLLRLL